MTLFSLNSNLYGDATWIGSEDKVFSNANNWTADPSGANLYIGNDAADMTLGSSMSIGSMYMGNGSTSANSSLTINNGGSLTGATMYIGQDATSTVTVGTGASITSSGNMLVGYSTGANGTLSVSGGNVTVNGSFLYIGGENNENSGNKGTGKVELSSGTISTKGCTIGNYGSATFDITGGTYNASGTIYMSNWNGASSMTVSNSGNVNCNILIIGQRGNSTLTLNNSAAVTIGPSSGSADYSDLGNISGSVGKLYVNDNASFTTNGNTNGIIIGNNGTGDIYQKGGTITLKGKNGVWVANQSTGKAEIDISGGSFTTDVQLCVGVRGAATINLSNSGKLQANKIVMLAPGYHANSSATINQTGGTFNADEGISYGGQNANKGNAQYFLSAGTLTTSTIKYANASKPPANTSIFEISGTGVANISGALAVPTNVKGGTLNANSIAIPANGTLTISGGTVNLGDGGITAAGTYTFTLSGGTFATNEASWETSLNATVAANSKITFAPESGQTITWEGAMTGNGDILKTGEGRLKINYDNENLEDIKFDVDNFTVSSGPVDIKGYMYCNLSVEGPDAVFSPGNSVGDAVFGGGFILKEGATLLIEQDASGIDTLTASSFNIDSNSIIDIAADSLQPGASYDIIFQTDSEGNPIIFTEAQATDDYWNNLLTPESAYYWNLSVSGNIVRASVDANAVPEPSTWALLALGVCGLLYLRKRKN